MIEYFYNDNYEAYINLKINFFQLSEWKSKRKISLHKFVKVPKEDSSWDPLLYLGCCSYWALKTVFINK